MSGFLAAVGLAPSLTPPATPAPAPATFVWAVLAFVRNEIDQFQRTYFNRTPDARNDSVVTGEDVAVTFDPRVNDRDDDTLKVTSVTNGALGTVSVSADGTTVTYTPNEAANGLAAGETSTDTFTYTVSDAGSAPHMHGFFGLFSRGHTDTATVTVTLTGANDAPTAVGADVTVASNQPLTGTLSANDIDGDTLTYALSGTGPAHGTVTISDAATGAYTYTPDAGYAGPDSFSFTATDTSGVTSNAAVVSITVNAAPQASANAEDPDSSGDVEVTFSWRDSAHDHLDVAVPTPQFGELIFQFGSGISFEPTQSGSLTYLYRPTAEARQAAANGSGPTSETLTFSVTDGYSTTSATVTVAIAPAETTVGVVDIIGGEEGGQPALDERIDVGVGVVTGGVER